MDIISRINWVDALIIILMIRMSYVAFQDGLSHVIFPLVGSIVMVVIGLNYYTGLGAFVSSNIPNIPAGPINLISFVVLVVGIGVVLRLFQAVLDKIIQVSWHPLIEKFGALAAGTVKAAITVSMVLIFLSLAPFPYLQRSVRDRSLLGLYFVRIGPVVYSRVLRFLPAIRAEGLPADSAAMVRQIVSDKPITTESMPEDAEARLLPRQI